MKLIRLTLEDFRQFLGRHTVEFATQTDRNVTIVYGANGAGKTTLLNAFTWVLYGQFTPDFEQPERLVNEHLWSKAAEGDELSARVTLEFEHEHSVYVLERVTTDRKGTEGRPKRVRDGEVHLDSTDEGGRNYEQRNPGDAIDRILPQRLHQFFFFNGERIEHLVQPTAYEEIEEAIKTILGLMVIERALRHLPQVRRNLEAELRGVGTPETGRLTERIEQVESRKVKLQEDHAQTKRNLAALDDELEMVRERLRSLEEVRALQADRDRAEAAFQQTEARLRGHRERIADTLDDRGFLAFTRSLVKQTQERFGELRTKREIPTPMKRQFVDDLLESAECICGTELVPGSEAHAKVLEWRRRVGLADVEEAWTRVSAHAEDFGLEQERLGAELDRLVGEVAMTRAERARLEEELSEIGRKLGESPSEQVRDLEARRVKLSRDRDSTMLQLGSLGRQIEEADRALAEAKRALAQAATRSQKEASAKRRVAVTDEAEQLFRKVLELRTHDVRQELDTRIKDIYRTITYKPYEPELNEDFQLTLRGGGIDSALPVAKSTGENQILSLSFVGALAALARERHEEARSAQGFVGLFSAAGGVFPIVMDAAFGTLDESYRREVARGLPSLAEQVVVFVSKAQGLGAVEQELRPRVGGSYVLHYLTTKDDARVESLEVGSSSYPYIDRTTDGVERAELLEI
jgi:DNA sulfur modification protein DndD